MTTYNKVRLSILATFDDEQVLDKAMQILIDWSSDHQEDRVYGWFKQRKQTATIFIYLPHEASPEQQSILYSRLSTLQGFGFVCTSFN